MFCLYKESVKEHVQIWGVSNYKNMKWYSKIHCYKFYIFFEKVGTKKISNVETLSSELSGGMKVRSVDDKRGEK